MATYVKVEGHLSLIISVCKCKKNLKIVSDWLELCKKKKNAKNSRDLFLKIR